MGNCPRNATMLSEELKRTIQTAYSQLLESKGIKARYGQRLMIAEVANTLASADQGKLENHQPPVCVVEAGTGTGKTIAYALAAIPIARALEKKLILTTATVALQEQIVYKDLPDIQQHSGLEFSFALAKGRGRYLCLSKLDALLQATDANLQSMALYPDEMPEQVSPEDLNNYQSMLSALSAGDWDGDKDSWLQELQPAFWSRITTDHAQCTGRRCSNVNQCSFFKAREQLDKVDVIVTNHDLVLADLALGGGAILSEPEDSIFVFDEGHHLPDKTINHFASFTRVVSTQRWLEQGIKALARAASELGEEALGSGLKGLPLVMETLRQQLGGVYQGMEQLFEAQPGQDPASFSSRRGDRDHAYLRFSDGLVPDTLREQAKSLRDEYANMYDLLDRVCDQLEEAMEASGGSVPRQQAENWFPPLSMMRSRAEANLQLWSDYSRAAAVEDPPQGRWISMLEGAGGNIDFEVSSSPIIAAGTLGSFLWNRCFAAVVTSATLAALGTFDRFALRAGTPSHTRYVRVPSPFNYAEAGELVVPAMDCDPSQVEQHTEAVIRLLPGLLRPGEGSLVLFASRRQMEDVFEGLESDWQQRILVQGNYSKQELLRLHRQAVDGGEASVIFGLASFAEGIDLPGVYCQHVVIAKIPFAVPDQPVESALAEWIKSRGGNPFMDIAVPDAAVKLVQASGRLLRTEADSGQITLLDRRIVTRRYGKAMLDSLPPFRRSLG